MTSIKRFPRGRPAQQPSIEGTARVLWGGIIDGVEIDFEHGTVLVNAHFLEEDRSTDVAIECHDLQALAFTNTVPWPWTYAQITEVYAATVPGGVRLELTLWMDETELAITAGSISIGGQPLVPPFSSVAASANDIHER